MKLREITGEKHFRTAVTVLLAGLTVATSGIVVLNNRASGRAVEAGRDARILGIRTLTHLGAAAWDFESEKRLMTSWLEMGGLMAQMEAYEKMTSGPEASLYRISRGRLAKLRDNMTADGKVSRPPYFDAARGWFNIQGYALDRFEIPAAELAERQEDLKGLGRFWGAKCDAYGTSLAVMAVAVFLLTLSMVLAGRVRFIIAGAGLALVLGIGTVVTATAARPWRGVSEESIREVARQSAWLGQASLVFNLAGLTDEAEARAKQVQAAGRAILERDPGFVSAVLLKSRAEEILGQVLLFKGRIEESRTELARAAEGLERAAAAGRDDGFLRWSLGFVELLRGRPAAALVSLDKALAALPEQGFPLGATKAFALLSQGRRAEAEAGLEAAIAWSHEHPIASNPQYYRTIVQNLERWSEAAPVEGLEAMVRRLKEAAVCVAYLGGTRPKPSAGTISSLEFIDPVFDKYGDIVDGSPTRSYAKRMARVPFFVEMAGLSRGQSIVSKVFWKARGGLLWIEQTRLTKSQHWEGPPQARILGEVSALFPEAGESLLPGDYRLEIYVDGALKTVGGFQAL